MKSCRIVLILLAYLISAHTNAQNLHFELNSNWQFRKVGTSKWYKATVPGTVHTDLLNNKLIPDPFYRDNETKLQWIDSADWEYRSLFNVASYLFELKKLELCFDGLDTYADVFLNGKLLLKADNMFRGWTVEVRSLLKKRNNILLIRFASAQKKVDSIAKSKLPLILPDNNRVYVRKAQFQFGWDWGPKFIGCGIWKDVYLLYDASRRSATKRWGKPQEPFAKLVQKPDSIGTSFYFEKDGKPTYIKGANWIPADIFLPRVKEEDYRRILQTVKDANINMLRVWGGGVYEDDAFYDICDSLGIMVWQDFMFAGGMYPGDDAFMQNVKEEVKYQIQRLKYHPCIVLWCGNNEVDEAWHNWGWQDQFNLHGADSAKVWNDYTRLFQDSLKAWVNEFDGQRAYVATSPKNGWGHKESFTEGDSHYWGIWWGLEDWEAFETKTGRFVSEYGMQAMPNMETIKTYTSESDRTINSPVINFHQKANEGFKKLNHYINRYFYDTTKLNKLSLEEYTYLSQCLQYYIVKNSIAIHRSKYPANMGTLLWQYNDCWPVTSWSITDYSREPKAAWYAVKEAYSDDHFEGKMADSFFSITLHSEKEPQNKIVKYTCIDPSGKYPLSTYTDTLDAEWKEIGFHPWISSHVAFDTSKYQSLFNTSFAKTMIAVSFYDKKTNQQLASDHYYAGYPKNIFLARPKFGIAIEHGYITITSTEAARYIYLVSPGIIFSDNYFDLFPGEKKIIKVNKIVAPTAIKVISLYDILNKK